MHAEPWDLATVTLLVGEVTGQVGRRAEHSKDLSLHRQPDAHCRFRSAEHPRPGRARGRRGHHPQAPRRSSAEVDRCGDVPGRSHPRAGSSTTGVRQPKGTIPPRTTSIWFLWSTGSLPHMQPTFPCRPGTRNLCRSLAPCSNGSGVTHASRCGHSKCALREGRPHCTSLVLQNS
jgi:hypothetical protein